MLQNRVYIVFILFLFPWITISVDVAERDYLNFQKVLFEFKHEILKNSTMVQDEQLGLVTFHNVVIRKWLQDLKSNGIRLFHDVDENFIIANFTTGQIMFSANFIVTKDGMGVNHEGSLVVTMRNVMIGMFCHTDVYGMPMRVDNFTMYPEKVIRNSISFSEVMSEDNEYYNLTAWNDLVWVVTEQILANYLLNLLQL